MVSYPTTVKSARLAVPAATALPVVDSSAGGPIDVTVVTKVGPPPPPVLPTDDQKFYIDWGSVLSVVFDQEGAGSSCFGRVRCQN
jgi:hypothetical protein